VLNTITLNPYIGFYPSKTDCHDITEILLKVVLNTITLNPYIGFYFNTTFNNISVISWQSVLLG
jgi:hypothetical protein